MFPPVFLYLYLDIIPHIAWETAFFSWPVSASFFITSRGISVGCHATQVNSMSIVVWCKVIYSFESLVYFTQALAYTYIYSAIYSPISYYTDTSYLYSRPVLYIHSSWIMLNNCIKYKHGHRLLPNSKSFWNRQYSAAENPLVEMYINRICVGVLLEPATFRYIFIQYKINPNNPDCKR